MIVVSNTSPLCYLLLIEAVDVLPILFNQISLPQAVRNEMEDPSAPAALKTWMQHPPAWIDIQFVRIEPDADLDRLHPGEHEAILLAEQLGADLILLDEKAARQVAASRGLNVTGLLGILDEAATRGLIDLPTTIDRLRQTTFRASPQLLKSVLFRHQNAQ